MGWYGFDGVSLSPEELGFQELRWAIDQDDDFAIAHVWANRLSLRTHVRVDPYISRVDLALQRTEAVDRLAAALLQGDNGDLGDECDTVLVGCRNLRLVDRLRVRRAWRIKMMTESIRTAIIAGDEASISMAFDKFLFKQAVGFTDGEKELIALARSSREKEIKHYEQMLLR